MSLTYNQYVTQIATLAVVSPTDPNFVTIIPSMIDYAELRIQRDIDFLQTVTADTSFSFTANNRNLSWTAGEFVTIQTINVITPYGATTTTGSRVQMLPTTKAYLDSVYGAGTGGGGTDSVPKYYTLLNNNTIIVGPWPDQNYLVELVGTQRFPSLSNSNQTNFISLYLPDLLIMASMIYISGYQRNFSSTAANDPQMPVNYETQYEKLLSSAQVEEARKRFQSSAWGSESPPIAASPSR